ncbi:hypothetical protein ACFS27_03295 [Promicromonospora vindobonensis]|uniref:Uncharacterized protein n=1 Tax=Promicromonospora vindobonensis TaxID=195748 RepID=A0ABW5VRD2_9MICO
MTTLTPGTTIKTPDTLDAAPVGTVVRDADGDLWARNSHPGRRGWTGLTPGCAEATSDDLTDEGPLVVVSVPLSSTPDAPTTPADLAAHIAAELEGTMPQRLDHAIVTTGYNRTDVAMRVRVQGVDLDAPDGVWVREFDVLVREAMTW